MSTGKWESGGKRFAITLLCVPDLGLDFSGLNCYTCQCSHCLAGEKALVSREAFWKVCIGITFPKLVGKS